MHHTSILRSWILSWGESPHELLSCKPGINQFVLFPKSEVESLVEEIAQAEYKFLFLTYWSLAAARSLGISYIIFSLQLSYTAVTKSLTEAAYTYANDTTSQPTLSLANNLFCCSLRKSGKLEKITPANDFSIDIKKKKKKGTEENSTKMKCCNGSTPGVKNCPVA